MSAADLANDQDRELAVVTAERDDLQLRLDEAEAVIDAVRKVRDGLCHSHTVIWSDWGTPPDRYRVGMHDMAKGTVQRMDRIDGL